MGKNNKIIPEIRFLYYIYLCPQYKDFRDLAFNDPEVFSVWLSVCLDDHWAESDIDRTGRLVSRRLSKWLPRRT